MTSIVQASLRLDISPASAHLPKPESRPKILAVRIEFFFFFSLFFVKRSRINRWVCQGRVIKKWTDSQKDRDGMTTAHLTLNNLHLRLLCNKSEENRRRKGEEEEEKEEGRRLGKSGRAARDGDQEIREMEGKKERDKQK